MMVLEKSKVHIAGILAVPCLDYFLKTLTCAQGYGTRMFTTALFVIVKKIRKNMTVNRKMGKLNSDNIYTIEHCTTVEMTKALCINMDKSQKHFLSKKGAYLYVHYDSYITF